MMIRTQWAIKKGDVMTARGQTFHANILSEHISKSLLKFQTMKFVHEYYETLNNVLKC